MKKSEHGKSRAAARLAIKYFLMMKLVILLIVGFAAQSFGRGHGQGVININLENVQIKQVLKTIESQGAYRFVYQSDLLSRKQRVSIKLQNATLEQALDHLLQNTSLTYRKLNESLIAIISKKGDNISSPLEVPVSGRITDENGRPLAGVSIVERGTSNGTVTDANGSFSLNVASGNSVLVISFIGFATQEIGVANRSSITLQLLSTTKDLDQVVVVGYGTQRQKDVTGSVASVSGKTLQKLPVTGLDQAMQGRVAGVTVTQSSAPGGPINVRIRGLGTINNNDPLYVIDGMPVAAGAINTLNVADIESIDVLKDASAGAIYGNRGANGVIIITTKRGERGRTNVTFGTYYGVQTAWKKLGVLNGPEYVTLMNESIQNSLDQGLPVNDAQKVPNPNDYPSITNWQNEIFRAAPMLESQLGISGGSDRTTYNFTLSYRDQQGTILNSEFKRYTFRSNIDNQTTDKLRLGSSITFSYADQSNVPNNDEWNGVVQSALSMPEMFPVINPATGGYFAPTTAQAPFFSGAQNPVGQAKRADSRQYNRRLFGSFYAQYELLKGLVFRTTPGVDIGFNSYKDYQGTYEGARGQSTAQLYQGSYMPLFWNWSNTLNYTRAFGKHNASLLVGSENSRFHIENIDGSRAGFPRGDNPTLRYLNYGDPATARTTGTAGEWSLMSYFGRFNYSFAGKYLLTANVRRDGTSRFIGDQRWGTFPSVSTGWKISDEGFMQGQQAFSSLKLRAGWGRVGNQSINANYPYLDNIGPGSNQWAGPNQTVSNYIFGGSLMEGVQITARGNRNLTWESTETWNFGIDGAVLNNRLNFTIDYFTRNTTGMLLAKELPYIAGAAPPPTINAGAVENKGIEVSVGYTKPQGDFTYGISANVASIKNRITDLGGLPYIDPGNNVRGGASLSRAAVGQPIGAFYGYKTAGIFQTQAEIDAAPKQEAGTRPGDIRFVNVDAKDNVINADDRTFLGDGFPDFTYGLNFDANYKHFDLSLFFQGVQGVKVFNSLKFLTMSNSGTTGNKSTEMRNRWTGPGTSNTVPRIIWNDPNNNMRVSDRFIEDGSYLRLKNIQIGYTLPTTTFGNSGIRSLRVYVGSQNLFTITKYTGFDPEIGTNPNREGNENKNLEIGVDRGAYPQARTVLVGFNVGF